MRIVIKEACHSVELFSIATVFELDRSSSPPTKLPETMSKGESIHSLNCFVSDTNC